MTKHRKMTYTDYLVQPSIYYLVGFRGDGTVNGLLTTFVFGELVYLLLAELTTELDREPLA